MQKRPPQAEASVREAEHPQQKGGLHCQVKQGRGTSPGTSAAPQQPHGACPPATSSRSYFPFLPGTCPLAASCLGPARMKLEAGLHWAGGQRPSPITDGHHGHQVVLGGRTEMGSWEGPGLPHRPSWTYGSMSSQPETLSAFQVGHGVKHPMGWVNPCPHTYSKIVEGTAGDGKECQGEDCWGVREVH